MGCRRETTTTPSLPPITKQLDSASVDTAIDESREAPGRFVIDDVAAELGVDARYENGENAEVLSIVESLGGGVGILDFDQDGRLDIALTGGGQFADQSTSGLPNSLFQNQGAKFRSIAGKASFNDCEFYSHGVCAGDYDNDGFRDLLITGYRGLALFKNMGDGTFLRQVAEGFPSQPLWCSSAAWGDFNRDGYLDLYIARYVNWSFENHPICSSSKNGQRDICPPKSFEPLPDMLLYSDGKAGYIDVSKESGLRSDGKGLGVLTADVDNDGDLDIYVANDTTDNFLYLNDGVGKFEEVGLKHGVAVDDRALPNGSMGIAVCDYDQNGWMDLWVANYEREAFALYQNQGQGQFTHVSRRTGVTSLGGTFVGFGIESVDLDMDGIQEVVVANGHVIRYPSAAPRKQLPLLLSQANGRFTREGFPKGNYFARPQEGRGLGTGDLNGDGRRDIVISHLNSPVGLLINRTPTNNTAIAVRLIGTCSNRDAIGTRVAIECGQQRIVQQITGGGSYLSTSDNAIQVPIGSNRHAKMTIYWANSKDVQTVDLEVSDPNGGEARVVTIVQPNGGSATND